jgi:hypothetical protein
VDGRQGGEEAEAELGARARGEFGAAIDLAPSFFELGVRGRKRTQERCEWGLIQDGKNNLFPAPVSLSARKLSTCRNFGALSKRV